MVAAPTRKVGEGRTSHIEDVQDQVELALMRGEYQGAARAYMLYRGERAAGKAVAAKARAPSFNVKAEDGSLVPLDEAWLGAIMGEPATGWTSRRWRRSSPPRSRQDYLLPWKPPTISTLPMTAPMLVPL